MLTIEQQLDKIADDNNLTSVTVGRMPVGDLLYYTANVHYEGFTRDGIPCSSEFSEISIQDALAKTLARAAANRAPVEGEPVALAPMSDAA